MYINILALKHLSVPYMIDSELGRQYEKETAKSFVHNLSKCLSDT